MPLLSERSLQLLLRVHEKLYNKNIYLRTSNNTNSGFYFLSSFFFIPGSDFTAQCKKSMKILIPCVLQFLDISINTLSWGQVLEPRDNHMVAAILFNVMLADAIGYLFTPFIYITIYVSTWVVSMLNSSTPCICLDCVLRAEEYFNKMHWNRMTCPRALTWMVQRSYIAYVISLPPLIYLKKNWVFQNILFLKAIQGNFCIL